MNRVLLIGFGNPGRMDDGLGPMLAEELEGAGTEGLDVESDYQLTVEDAEAVSRYDKVIFVDASANGPEPFDFREIQPGGAPGFSSHSVEPDEVLMLAKTLFGKTPKAYLMGIRGYEFNEFGEGLSERAAGNLKSAVEFVRMFVKGVWYEAG